MNKKGFIAFLLSLLVFAASAFAVSCGVKPAESGLPGDVELPAAQSVAGSWKCTYERQALDLAFDGLGNGLATLRINDGFNETDIKYSFFKGILTLTAFSENSQETAGPLFYEVYTDGENLLIRSKGSGIVPYVFKPVGESALSG